MNSKLYTLIIKTILFQHLILISLEKGLILGQKTKSDYWNVRKL